MGIIEEELQANLASSADTSSDIQTKKTRQWIKARGRISSTDKPEFHLPALAYMSDSYFIGTVARVHNLWRFSSSGNDRGRAKTKSPSMAKMEDEENSDADKERPRASIGMMVSLDHTIYFHRPREIKADEWMLSENESPWSGDGRGLVFQRIWNRNGVLVATCVQEVSRRGSAIRCLRLFCFQGAFPRKRPGCEVTC